MSVQAVEAFTPYSNTTGLFTEGLPTWMDAYDAERIHAYQVYEQIYWNVPDTFKLVLRGTENSSPVYIPTARTIVDTTNRFLCPRPAFVVDPDLGTPQDQADCKRMFSSLFRRERFWSKFQANKLYGVMRGDWVWHITANPTKPAGSRIKIEAVDPAAYFPVSHPTDPDRIIAVYLVEQVADEKGDIFIKRQTYKRGADPVNNDGSDTTIYNDVAIFNIDQWQALDDRAVSVEVPEHALPPQISAIPVYHIRNIETPNDPYGSSEIRGFERIMAAVNQAISDEELALALEGLGLYATDGGPPRDERGNPTDWVLGPGRVVEHGNGSKFERVNGVNSVAPVQDHLNFLITQLKEASATPDAAVGKVDVQVAESGIALAMQLHPLLAKVDVRTEPITDVHNQMFWDLRAWFAAYEQFVTPCVVEAYFDNRLPVNTKERVAEILSLVGAGIADSEWARQELVQYGYDFPTDTGLKVMNEARARALATDPFASRMEEENDVTNQNA